MSIERFEVKGKSCMSVSGVDFGTHLVILKETDKYILCRKPGHRGWCGIGESKYYGPEFIIFKKVGDDEVKHCTGEHSFEYNRQTKKKVWAKALDIFKQKERLK